MIVGILGPAASGKDTMADHLVSKYGFVKVGLADPLKRICKDIYAFSDAQLWGPSEARNQPDLRYPLNGKGFLTPRTALQALGTEWGRTCYVNTWIDYGIRVAKEILQGKAYHARTGITGSSFPSVFSKKPTGVVFSDLRFKNELRAVQKSEGVTIRLRREGTGGDVLGGIANHPSEVEQQSLLDSEFDCVLLNPPGIPNFHSEIDKLFLRLPALTRLRIG